MSTACNLRFRIWAMNDSKCGLFHPTHESWSQMGTHPDLDNPPRIHDFSLVSFWSFKQNSTIPCSPCHWHLTNTQKRISANLLQNKGTFAVKVSSREANWKAHKHENTDKSKREDISIREKRFTASWLCYPHHKWHETMYMDSPVLDPSSVERFQGLSVLFWKHKEHHLFKQNRRTTWVFKLEERAHMEIKIPTVSHWTVPWIIPSKREFMKISSYKKNPCHEKS